MSTLSPEIQSAITAISRISVVPKILEVICRTTGMGFAAVARVTDEKWVACSVRDEINFGLIPGGELNLESTICHEIRQTGQGVIIDHVAEDIQFQDHHTPKMYGFQSYISIPIYLKNGIFFGTLCAIDPSPARLKDTEIVDAFRLYSDLIAFHLSALDQVDSAETELLEERKALKLREQFIAILGHDLRNPLSAIASSIQLILRQHLDDKTRKLAEIVKNSSFRMKELIDNILDLARTAQGSGISLNIQVNQPISKLLKEVIVELQTVWPDKKIELTEDLCVPVKCDANRIGQLLSNLLGNALTHGDKSGPIRVKATSDKGYFNLAVTNNGTAIPKERLTSLFQPYVRGEDKNGSEGLGLGLFICSEIAKGHGGQLQVVSNEKETTFTLVLPC